MCTRRVADALWGGYSSSSLEEEEALSLEDKEEAPLSSSPSSSSTSKGKNPPTNTTASSTLSYSFIMLPMRMHFNPLDGSFTWRYIFLSSEERVVLRSGP